jgi:hypothetical protein
MKKICVLILALILSNILLAQKFVPQVGVGSVLTYNMISTSSGQQIPLTLRIISLNNPMKLKWDLPGLGTGSFLIPAKALESGSKMRLEEPTPNDNTTFRDDQTIMFISKNAFAEMMKDQAFKYDRLKFIVKPEKTAFKINDKEADVIHATTSNGRIEIWILNDPYFPIICKFIGNPSGIDFNLQTVKE